MAPNEIQKIKNELWNVDNFAAFAAAPKGKILVAEGDSWFDYPPELDILDNLKKYFGYEIDRRISKAGDTLENMVYGTDIDNGNLNRKYPQINATLDAIKLYKPKAVLFSAGGNDLAGQELDSFLNHKDSGLKALRVDFLDYVINTVFRKAYVDFAKSVWEIDNKLPILTHGYGYPIPDGRGVTLVWGLFKYTGPWLKPSFAKKNIGFNESLEIMKIMIDSLNEMLKKLSHQLPLIKYIDLRNLVKEENWVNELHVDSETYKKIAAEFDKVIKLC